MLQSLGPLVLWQEHWPPGGAVEAEISKGVVSALILNRKSLNSAARVRLASKSECLL